MLIRDLLPVATSRMICIECDSALLLAARQLTGDHEMLLVRDAGGRLAGVLTKTDIVRQTGRCAGASCTQPVLEVMTRDVTVTHPDEWVHDTWEVMKSGRFKNVPIIDGDRKPLGILNARDVLQALLKEGRDEQALLYDYVLGIGYR